MSCHRFFYFTTGCFDVSVFIGSGPVRSGFLLGMVFSRLSIVVRVPAHLRSSATLKHVSCGLSEASVIVLYLHARPRERRDETRVPANFFMVDRDVPDTLDPCGKRAHFGLEPSLDRGGRAFAKTWVLLQRCTFTVFGRVLSAICVWSCLVQDVILLQGHAHVLLFRERFDRGWMLVRSCWSPA